MKIISGTLRSRSIKTVEGEGYRPAMGKVRESLFSMLTSRIGSFEGLNVLDLFAGSGSLAFECLSRGAKSASLVELSQTALRCLGENVANLGLEGRALLFKEDVLKLLRRTKTVRSLPSGPFDLVFLDPPYRKHFIQGSLEALCECSWLSPNAFVVLEVEAGLDVDVPSALSTEADKSFGQTRILMLKSLPPA